MLSRGQDLVKDSGVRPAKKGLPPEVSPGLQAGSPFPGLPRGCRGTNPNPRWYARYTPLVVPEFWERRRGDRRRHRYHVDGHGPEAG